MNAALTRETVSHAVIIAAVCIGAWMLFVQSKMHEVAELEATAALVHSDDGEITQADIETAGRKMAQIHNQVEQIEAGNRLSRDTSKMYGMIMDLAGKHGVAVQTIAPGAIQKSEETGVTMTRVDVTAEGRFDHVASFLAAMDHIDGFVRPVSLAITPLSDGPGGAVVIRFGCEALAFELPPALAAMAGGDHGQR